MTGIELVVPAAARLPSYLAALERGWLPSNVSGAEIAAEEMAQIKDDPARFVAMKEDDREAKGGPIRLPDGSSVPRLPGIVRWMWDGEFCGSIGLRWTPGTATLPAHVLGHIGYAVVPWKRRRGVATKGLALMLLQAKAEDLPHVELTTDPDNVVSQRVILANGGVLVERFRMSPQYGPDQDSLRFRIDLPT